jgi:hypothetical protein
MEITDPLYSNSLKNLIQGLSEAARKGWMEVGDAERLTRVLMSQGNDRFADSFVTENFNALREPEVAAAIASKLATPVAKAQQGLNYSFGTEGHHGISVSSIEAASRHLPFEQRLEFLKALKDDYTYSGTDPEDMFPLSGIAHQQKGTARNTDPYNAHFDSDPKTLANTFKPNQGTWQNEDYTNITDPRKLAAEFWNRSGSPQIRAAEIAFDQPSEVAWREGLASQLGIRERNLYLHGQTDGKPVTATNKAALGELGIKNETLKQGMQEAYGQTYRPPNPDAPKKPYEARPPRPWAESKVLNPNYKPPATAAKTAAGVAPTPKPPISQIDIPRVNPRALAIGAAIPGAVGAVFDGAALASGAQQMRSNDPRAKLAGALDAVSGATGLAALAPTPATPALGTISAAAGLASQAVTHKVDQHALKVAPKVVKAVNKVDNAVNPVRNAINSAIQSGSNWFLNQLRIKR